MDKLKCRKLLLLLIGMILTIGLAIEADQDNRAPASAEPAGPNFAVIDSYISKQMHDLQIPGVALAIVQNDQIIHLRGFGVADDTGRAVTPQTPFRIGSITKSFTALAVMQLVEAGKIDLEAPVERYLPWFRVADETSSAQIKIKHLLNQTTGLSTLAGNGFWDSQDGLEAVVRQLKTVKLQQPVGARWQYSNLNYSIAGLVVEAVSGQSYADYIVQHIFTPLLMRHSHATTASAEADGLALGHLYSVGHMIADRGVAPPAYLPAGFLSVSVEDMAHYALAQLNGGRSGEAAVLSRQGIAELHRPAVSIGSMDAFYGMGWVIGSINGIQTVWHNGDTGRFHAMIILAPDRGEGIVLLANASGLEYLVAVDDMAKGVLSMINGQSSSASSPARTRFRLIYWGGLLTPALLLIGIAQGFRRWKRGDFKEIADQPHGRRKQAWRILWMVIPNLTVGSFFMFGVPRLTGLPFSGFRILYPDLSYALLAGMVIGIGWSVMYAAMVLLAKHHSI